MLSRGSRVTFVAAMTLSVLCNTDAGGRARDTGRAPRPASPEAPSDSAKLSDLPSTATSTSPPAPASAPASAQAPSAASVAAPSAPSLPHPSSGALPALPPVKPPMNATQVITVLDQTVGWYRTLGIQQQAATEPSDQLILYDNRQTADRVMAFAFDIARVDADMLGRLPLAVADTSDSPLSSQALMQLRLKLDAQDASVRAELEAARRSIAKSKKPSGQVTAKMNELQGELDLINTKKGILATLTSFISGNGTSSSGALKAQIDAMAVTIPSAAAATASAGAATAAMPSAAAPPSRPQLVGITSPMGRVGLWELASNAYRLTQKSRMIESIDERTKALQGTVIQLRTPLVDQIKTLSARGDALAAQADSADSSTLNGLREQLEDLATQFKQASALLIPLSRENILLSQYRRNLSNWQETVETQSGEARKTLGIRVGLLLFILALLFTGTELWRRAVLRYVHDSRRRSQLLLLRRIILWSLVVIVIGIDFASELGSIVTFAGLITAGIAVAMQSVLVSIVGYFYLIGKYGIRVGDRVQIGAVSGEVIDLGLVRLYLMELGPSGDGVPTGRVVAFANSVVFQVSSGIFKQIPGVNFTWREMVLHLPPAADYGAIKEQLMTAATAALKDYRTEILRQTKVIEHTTMSTSGGEAGPQVQLQFSATGVEGRVRYPVPLQHAAAIEERVTEALTNVVATLTSSQPQPQPQPELQLRSQSPSPS